MFSQVELLKLDYDIVRSFTPLFHCGSKMLGGLALKHVFFMV